MLGCNKTGGPDLIFVLDSSGSIGSTNFRKVKNFVKDVVGAFEIGSDKTRIGIIQFSSSSRVYFHLNRYQSKSAVISAVDRMRYV